MTHIFFDPDKINWAPFLQTQIGGGEGKFFVGTRWQRGYGGFLHSIARFLVPLAKNIASSAGQEGLAAGTRILSDVSQGKDLRESLKEHSQKSLDNLQAKLSQCGKGKRKKPKKAIKPKSHKAIMDQLSML